MRLKISIRGTYLCALHFMRNLVRLRSAGGGSPIDPDTGETFTTSDAMGTRSRGRSPSIAGRVREHLHLRERSSYDSNRATSSRDSLMIYRRTCKQEQSIPNHRCFQWDSPIRAKSGSRQNPLTEKVILHCKKSFAKSQASSHRQLPPSVSNSISTSPPINPPRPGTPERQRSTPRSEVTSPCCAQADWPSTRPESSTMDPFTATACR